MRCVSSTTPVSAISIGSTAIGSAVLALRGPETRDAAKNDQA